MGLLRASQLIGRLRSFLQEGPLHRQLRAVLLLALGWLLSPLCWWNDLLINLPLAWGFAWLLQQINPAWFTPGLVLGYWLSNITGILLLQAGALTVFAQEGEARDPRREILVGLLTSTAYSLVVVLLVQSGVLRTPLGEGMGFP